MKLRQVLVAGDDQLCLLFGLARGLSGYVARWLRECICE